MILIKNIIKQKPCQKACLFPIELQYPSSHQLLNGYPKTNPEKCNTISDKQNDWIYLQTRKNAPLIKGYPKKEGFESLQRW